MLTLRQLMLMTPSEIRKKKTACRSRVISAVRSSDDKGVFDEIRFRVTCTKKPYLVVFRLYDPTKPALKRNTWVHCACPFFKFNVETALAARGSADIVNSNGTFPRIKNPRFTPYICKHIYAAAPQASRAQPTKEVGFKSLKRIPKTK